MLYYLLFFPSITFAIVNSEIFPWALIFVVFYMREIDRMTLFLILVLIASSIFTAIHSIYLPHLYKTDIFRSFGAYLNIILIFRCILYFPPDKIDKLQKVARNIFIFLIILGILQHFTLLSGINNLIQFLVPRARGSALVELGGRGVTLLSSEPARAGIELMFIYMLVRLNSAKTTWFILADIFILAFVVVVIKAASAAAFSLMIIMLITSQKPKNIVIWVSFTVIGVAVTNIEASGRILVLLAALQDFSEFSAILFFIANESGHRLLALYAFVLAGFTNLLGFGIGGWKEASIWAIENSGIDYSSFRYFQKLGNGHAIAVRAPGVLPNLMLDIGVIGVSFFCYWIFYVTKQYRRINKNSKIILFILFAKIILFGSLGNPIPWVVTAILLKLVNQAKDEPQAAKNTNDSSTNTTLNSKANP